MLLTFLEEVEIAKIAHSKKPIRHSSFGNIEELAMSIAEKGLLQPIIVRPLGDAFEVVAGNRRLEACKMLGWRKVTCHVVELGDKEAYEVSLVENLQRKTMDPIEEAQAFKNYIDGFGYGAVSELAKQIGKSQEYVSKRLKLLSLPEDVKAEVMSRRITPSVAEELAGFDRNDIGPLKDMILSHQLKRQDLRALKMVRNGYEPSEVDYEKKKNDIKRSLNQSVAALKMCLARIDDILDFLDDENIIELNREEWIIRDYLFELRMRLHKDIDDTVRFKVRFEKNKKYN
ncbi:MAG: ParB/RepB/Spo0J family partition protein [Nitrososphaerota archaeon]|jgi:ParB family chromosome partitioning protein|nr:ParB/RepB/Spo0J family partition protein [Nitrososphaerota archaeon]MDG6935395.1 ParB/RepB/Spo0J family partition protein [Nitrososphaerota archaeon]